MEDYLKQRNSEYKEDRSNNSMDGRLFETEKARNKRREKQ